MINVFDKSRKIRNIGFFTAVFASFAFAIYIYISSGISLRIFSAIVLLFFLIGVIYFVALFSAVKSHQNLLNILYNKVDPKNFISKYSVLINNEKISPTIKITLKAHLANAYANMGDMENALPLLKDTKAPNGRHEANVALLVAGNVLSYYLLADDIDNSKKAYEALDKLILQYKKEGKTVNPSFIRNKKIQKINLDILLGAQTDEGLLYQELRISSNKLHIANVQYLLGKVYIAKNNKKTAIEYFQSAAQYKNILAGQKASEILLNN